MASQIQTSIRTITSFQDFCFYVRPRNHTHLNSFAMPISYIQTSQDKPTVIDFVCKVTIPSMARMAKAFPHIRFYNLNMETEHEDLLKVMEFVGIDGDRKNPRFVVFRKGERIYSVSRNDNAELEIFMVASPTWGIRTSSKRSNRPRQYSPRTPVINTNGIRTLLNQVGGYHSQLINTILTPELHSNTRAYLPAEAAVVSSTVENAKR